MVSIDGSSTKNICFVCGFHEWKLRRRFFSYLKIPFSARTILSDVRCFVSSYPSFYSNYEKQSSTVSVFKEFYKKYTKIQNYFLFS